MNQDNRSKTRLDGGFIGLGAGVGSGLGAAVGAITGDLHWIPIVLSACIMLGVLAAWQTQR